MCAAQPVHACGSRPWHSHSLQQALLMQNNAPTKCRCSVSSGHACFRFGHNSPPPPPVCWRRDDAGCGVEGSLGCLEHDTHSNTHTHSYSSASSLLSRSRRCFLLLRYRMMTANTMPLTTNRPAMMSEGMRISAEERDRERE